MIDHIHLDKKIFIILFLLKNIMKCFIIYSSLYSDRVHIEINKFIYLHKTARGGFQL
jgi:hypothetical protein